MRDTCIRMKTSGCTAPGNFDICEPGGECFDHYVSFKITWIPLAKLQINLGLRDSEVFQTLTL